MLKAKTLIGVASVTGLAAIGVASGSAPLTAALQDTDVSAGADQSKSEPVGTPRAQTDPEQTEPMTHADAVEWLRVADSGAKVSQTGEGEVIHFSGFVKESDLTEEVLSALNEGSIQPRYFFLDGETSEYGRVEIVRSQTLSGKPANCVGLVQVAREDRNKALSNRAQAAIEEARHQAPIRPLDSECRLIEPWPDAIEEGSVFETDEGPAFQAGNVLVKVDDRLSCSDFGETRNDGFALSPHAKFNIAMVTNVAPPDGLAGPWVTRAFVDTWQGLKSQIDRHSPPPIKSVQLLADQGVRVDANDVHVLFAVISDAGADAFCFAIQFEQEGKVWQETALLAREGRRLPWDGETHGPAWEPTRDARSFYRSAGEEFAKGVTMAVPSDSEPQPPE